MKFISIIVLFVVCLSSTAWGHPSPKSPWSSNQVLSLDGVPSGEPAVAADGNGHVYVAFMENVAEIGPGMAVRVLSSEDSGKTFKSVARFQTHWKTEGTRELAFVGDVTLAVSPQGDVYFSYIDYWDKEAGPITNEAKSDIIFVTSHDFGKTWSAPQIILSQITGSTDRPWLTVGTDGTIAMQVAVLRDFLCEASSFYSRSKDGGITWSAPVLLGSARYQGKVCVGTSKYTPIALAPYNEVFWTTISAPKSRSQSIQIVRSSNALPFSKIFEQNAKGMRIDGNDFPIVAIAGNDLCLAYPNSQGELFVRRLRSDGTAVPGDRGVRVSTPGKYTQEPRPWMVADAKGSCHLLWMELDDTKSKSTARLRSATFQPDRTLTGPYDVSDTSFIIVEGDRNAWIGDFVSIAVGGNKLYATWSDTRSKIARIYLSTAVTKK